MDCEKFDRVVLDLLYAELDELTAASAKRHTEHCTRCRGILSELRATREVGALPLVDPPEGLELKILDAERQARAGLPLRQRFGRAISVLAGYAMRPQLAMAALLLLLIGSSLFILRGRPGDRDSVLVTERGVPETETEALTIPLPAEVRPRAAAPRDAEQEEARAEAKAAKPVTTAPAPAPAAAEPAEQHDSDFASGLALFDEGRYVEARRALDSVATSGGPHAAEAALYAARATEQTEGCGSATRLFEEVSARYPGSKSAHDAVFRAADCYKRLGEYEQARRSYEALLATSYEERARTALARLEDESSTLAARRQQAAKRATGAGAGAAPAGAVAPAGKGEASPAPVKASKPAPAADSQ